MRCLSEEILHELCPYLSAIRVRRIILNDGSVGCEEGGMPRQVRIEYAGATYHVMCRGDRREDIYLEDDDRRMFLATIAEAVGTA